MYKAISITVLTIKLHVRYLSLDVQAIKFQIFNMDFGQSQPVVCAQRWNMGIYKGAPVNVEMVWQVCKSQ